MNYLRNFADRLYEKKLENEIKYIPEHIAIIQDGNRRFAKERGFDVSVGHRLGAETTDRVLTWARDIGVKHVTLYCFSTENFNRSAKELRELFTLFSDKAVEAVNDERTHKNRVKIQMIGDRSMIPEDLLKKIEHVEDATRDYDRFTLNLAVAYGGRNEILGAAKSLLAKVESGEMKPEDITKETFAKNLYRDQSIPPVDLIIRTGNEKRTSNFLPWLANGNESAVYFCAPYWPVFRKIDLLRGIRIYDKRMRELKN